MSIVSSIFALVGPTQADGRQFVRETHTDNVAIQHFVDYLAAVGANYTAIMNARAITLAVQIADQEFADNLGKTSGFTLNYQTRSELASRFRAIYLSATRDVACSMAYWLIERINDGTVTDAQVQAAFGLTALQYSNMKARATTMHDHWAAVLVAVGE
jgi:hypothetical protein